MRRNRWAIPLVAVVMGSTLSACSGSNSVVSRQNNPMSTYNLFACSAIDAMFMEISDGKTVSKYIATQMTGYGKKAENPAIRAAAILLQTQANDRNQAGVNAAIGKYAAACHAIGNGPGDNSGK